MSEESICLRLVSSVDDSIVESVTVRGDIGFTRITPLLTLRELVVNELDVPMIDQLLYVGDELLPVGHLVDDKPLFMFGIEDGAEILIRRKQATVLPAKASEAMSDLKEVLAQFNIDEYRRRLQQLCRKS